MMSPMSIEELFNVSKEIRKLIIKMTTIAGSGHPGPSMSIADIITILYFHEMRLDPANPHKMDRDRFVLSKGHAAPALYAALIKRGFIGEDSIHKFRVINGILQGHPCVTTPGIDANSGSLGLGLSTACGMALGMKKTGNAARVFALIGDGESDEGQIWEAGIFAAHYKLDNLYVFTDRNGLQFEGTTCEVMNTDSLEKKWEAFGWDVRTINGHDLGEIINALDAARKVTGKPKMIIANTVKGKGVSFMVGQAYHYHVTSYEDSLKAYAEIDATKL
jgi:transketolase